MIWQRSTHVMADRRIRQASHDPASVVDSMATMAGKLVVRLLLPIAALVYFTRPQAAPSPEAAPASDASPHRLNSAVTVEVGGRGTNSKGANNGNRTRS